MRVLEIEGLAIDSLSNDMVIILKTCDEGELLPIWIGNAEAVSIALAMLKIVPPRPMTHDFLANILNGLNIKLQKVVISALVDNTYYALLYLLHDDELVVIDARPSDSIALAIRTGSTIYLEKDVPTVSADENDEDRKSIEKRLRRIDPDKLLGIE